MSGPETWPHIGTPSYMPGSNASHILSLGPILGRTPSTHPKCLFWDELALWPVQHFHTRLKPCKRPFCPGRATDLVKAQLFGAGHRRCVVLSCALRLLLHTCSKR